MRKIFLLLALTITSFTFASLNPEYADSLVYCTHIDTIEYSLNTTYFKNDSMYNDIIYKIIETTYICELYTYTAKSKGDTLALSDAYSYDDIIAWNLQQYLIVDYTEIGSFTITKCLGYHPYGWNCKKKFENGQIVITRNGVRYTILGAAF